MVRTAAKMGAELGLDLDKVRLAALLHDYAKDMPPEELLDIGRREGLIESVIEEVQPDLLHGPVGAFLCRQELGIDDEEILQAIRYHSTANSNMSDLDIVIFLADLLEPGRNYKGVGRLRSLCAKDLSACLLQALDETIEYVLKKRLLLHPRTVEARNWLIGTFNKEEFDGEQGYSPPGC